MSRFSRPSELVQIGVYYDFSSVMCYVAQRVMTQVSAELQQSAIELVWLPVDLTVLTGWNRGDRMKRRRGSNALGTIDQLLEGPVIVPDHWMDSRLASAVASGLQGDPREATWRAQVFESVYADGRSLDGTDLVAEHAEALAVEVPNVDEAHCMVERATRDAVAVGVVGVPSFLLGEWPVGGIQDPLTMVSFLRRFADRARQPEASTARN